MKTFVTLHYGIYRTVFLFFYQLSLITNNNNKNYTFCTSHSPPQKKEIPLVNMDINNIFEDRFQQVVIERILKNLNFFTSLTFFAGLLLPIFQNILFAACLRLGLGPPRPEPRGLLRRGRLLFHCRHFCFRLTRHLGLFLGRVTLVDVERWLGCFRRWGCCAWLVPLSKHVSKRIKLHGAWLCETIGEDERGA